MGAWLHGPKIGVGTYTEKPPEHTRGLHQTIGSSKWEVSTYMEMDTCLGQ